MKRYNIALLTGLLLLAVFLVFEFIRSSLVTNSPSVVPSGTGTNRTFYGTLQSGSLISEKNYCKEGVYLVAKEGTYLINQTQSLLLRQKESDTTKSQPQSSVLYSDQEYMNTYVRVSGVYPAQTFFCEALTCSCEDYILVEDISVATP